MTTDQRIGLVAGALLSGAMSLTLAGFFTLLALGPGPGWPLAWATSFAMGWPLAFALAALLRGPTHRLARRLAG